MRRYSGDVSSHKIKFNGCVQTRTAVALLVLAGQNGLSNIIPIMFGGNGAIEDISNQYVRVPESGVNAGITVEEGALTIPFCYDGWGQHTIISLDKNLSWTYE